MTYEKFKEKYDGKYLDFDKYYGNQCWDLAQYYFTECLDVPSWVLSGSGLVSNMLYPPKRNDLDQYFDEVSIYSMQQGDVVIWEYGHIAIYDHWDGNYCYFFSQNYPLGSPCHIQLIDEGGMHAFRRKGRVEVTPNVERDVHKNQIEVKVEELNVRNQPSTKGKSIGHASVGFYDFYETKEEDGYVWYNIANEQWIASSDEWTTVYPKQRPLSYQAHVQDIGDQEWKYSGEVAGTTGLGLRLEGLRIDFPDVSAKVHVQNKSWIDYPVVTPDTLIGTEGEGLAIECICLKGNFIYRVHITEFGWTPYTKADGICTLGTVGQGLRIEAIEIKEI